MAVHSIFYVRRDGSLHGRVAWNGEIGDLDGDFLDRSMLVACGLVVDGVSRFADLGNDFCVLSDYVDCDQHSGVYCDTAFLRKNIAKKAWGRAGTSGNYNIIYTHMRVCVKKPSL